jgi:Tol biopolymer transport system component
VQLTRTTGVMEGLGVNWSYDGRIRFGAWAGTTSTIHSMDPDTGEVQEIPTRGADFWPDLTPDGKTLVFNSVRDGDQAIYTAAPDGSNATRISQGPVGWQNTLSPDGRWVVYVGGDKSNAYRMPIDGGPAQVLNDRICEGDVAVSPDGAWVAVETWDPESSTRGVDIFPFEGGAVKQRLDIRPSGIRWSQDGRSLTAVMFEDGADNLFEIPLDGGERKQLTFFDEPFIGDFAWSPDGKRIVLVRGSTDTDLVLLKGFR